MLKEGLQCLATASTSAWCRPGTWERIADGNAAMAEPGAPCAERRHPDCLFFPQDLVIAACSPAESRVCCGSRDGMCTSTQVDTLESKVRAGLAIKNPKQAINMQRKTGPCTLKLLSCPVEASGALACPSQEPAAAVDKWQAPCSTIAAELARLSPPPDEVV